MMARPLLLLLLALLPLWWWHRRRAQRRAASFSDTRHLGAVARARGWVGAIPAGLRSVALAAWILAAAGPQWGGSRRDVSREGIDIALTVDVSSSMLAEDFAPNNRLDVAKEQSLRFIRGRTSDRIGLISFSGEALTRVPLTLDHAVLDQAVRDLRIGELEDGTAIGTAIATAANRLRRAPSASKVIVLLTDGENNRGRIDPRTAAAAAAQVGIRIYAIGVGTQGEARLPVGHGPEGLRYRMMPVKIDEQLLDEIATASGGRYFRATDAEALTRIFQQIDQLERSPIRSTQFTQRDESYRVPLLIGLAALALELVVAATWVVRVP